MSKFSEKHVTITPVKDVGISMERVVTQKLTVEFSDSHVVVGDNTFKQSQIDSAELQGFGWGPFRSYMFAFISNGNLISFPVKKS